MANKVNYQQVLNDFIETSKANPNMSDAELMEYFPEFNGQTNLLQSAKDYMATKEQNDFDVKTLNGYFPEFFGETEPPIQGTNPPVTGNEYREEQSLNTSHPDQQPQSFAGQMFDATKQGVGTAMKVAHGVVNPAGAVMSTAAEVAADAIAEKAGSVFDAGGDSKVGVIQWLKNAGEDYKKNWGTKEGWERLGKNVAGGAANAVNTIGRGLISGVNALSGGMPYLTPSGEERITPTIDEQYQALKRINDGTATDKDRETASGALAIEAGVRLEKKLHESSQSDLAKDADFVELARTGRISSFMREGIYSTFSNAGNNLLANQGGAEGKAVLAASVAGNRFHELSVDNPDTTLWKRAVLSVGEGAISQWVESQNNPFRFLEKADDRTGGILGAIEDQASRKLYKKLLRNAGKAAWEEGKEEVEEDILDRILETMLDVEGKEGFGFFSDINSIRIQNPELSKSQALWILAKSKTREYLNDFIGGAISGGIMGGGSTLRGERNFRKNYGVSSSEYYENLSEAIDATAKELGISREEVGESVDEVLNDGAFQLDQNVLDVNKRVGQKFAEFASVDMHVDNRLGHITNSDGNIYHVNDGNGDGYIVMSNVSFREDGTIDLDRSDKKISIIGPDGSVGVVSANSKITLIEDVHDAETERRTLKARELARIKNEETFKVGDKVYMTANGQVVPDAQPSEVVDVNDEGVTITTENPDGTVGTATIPHEQAAEGLTTEENAPRTRTFIDNVSGDRFTLFENEDGDWESEDGAVFSNEMVDVSLEGDNPFWTEEIAEPEVTPEAAPETAPTQELSPAQQAAAEYRNANANYEQQIVRDIEAQEQDVQATAQAITAAEEKLAKAQEALANGPSAYLAQRNPRQAQARKKLENEVAKAEQNLAKAQQEHEDAKQGLADLNAMYETLATDQQNGTENVAEAQAENNSQETLPNENNLVSLQRGEDVNEWRDQLQEALDRDCPVPCIVATEEDIKNGNIQFPPIAVREIKKGRKVNAFYDGNNIYVVADNLADGIEADAIVLNHECVHDYISTVSKAHYGLATFAKNHNREDLLGMLSYVGANTDFYGEQYPSDSRANREALADELVAHISETSARYQIDIQSWLEAILGKNNPLEVNLLKSIIDGNKQRNAAHDSASREKQNDNNSSVGSGLASVRPVLQDERARTGGLGREGNRSLDESGRQFGRAEQVEDPTNNTLRYSINQAENIEEGSNKYFDTYYNGNGEKKRGRKPHAGANLTQGELEVANAVIYEMVDYMRPYLDAVDNGKRVLPEEVLGTRSDNTIMSNGSYGKTMENTSICLRTLAYNDFVDNVKKQIGRPLTQRESFLASQMVYDIAHDPQCLYCYVSLDRKAYDEFLLRYVEERESVLNEYRELKNKDAKGKAPHVAFAFVYNRYLDGRKDTKNMQDRFDSWINTEANGEPFVTNEMLTTAEIRSGIREGENKGLADQMKDIEAYARSASWAKKNIDYRAYNGELLDLSENWLNKLMNEYGLRFYSFSEYSPAFIVENMQMVRDAALRGLKGLAYTKETDFVRIFANTGININCSCYGRRDANGNITMDRLQGADWNEVQELRAEHPNVGAVFVATDDNMVEWALAQDWIDIVIPFHIVRTGADIADFYKWTNYSASQADKQIGGQKSKYISPAEHHNNKEIFLQLCQEQGYEPRFKEWVENPNYMKLVNETRRSVDESEVIRPEFDLEAAKESFDHFVDRGGYYGGWWDCDEQGYVDAVERVVEDIKAGRQANEVEYGRQDFPVDADKMGSLARKRRQHQNTPARLRFSVGANVEVKESLAELDDAYMEAYNNYDEDGMFEAVEKAAIKAGYKLRGYHHTENDMTVFDRSKARKSMDVQGFFFYDDPVEGEEYGSKIYDVFLKMDNPYVIDSKEKADEYHDKYFKFGETNAGVVARERLQEDGYDGIISTADYLGSGANEYVVFEPNQIKSAEAETYDDNDELIPLSARFNDYNPDIRFSVANESNLAEEGGVGRFSIIKDKNLINKLESEPKIRVYRAMLVDENGNLMPPMSSKGISSTSTTASGKRRAGKRSNAIHTEDPMMGQWEQSEEHKEAATYNEGDDYAHVTIYDDAGGSTPVAYNPYIHTSLQMLNDQFAKAWRRLNMVVVECEIPVSELTSGYKAEWAKNAVGKTTWKSGAVSNKLKKTPREVILTRYAKPIRIVSMDEYADSVKKLLQDNGILEDGVPFNVVTPEQREALYEAGVPIAYPSANGRNEDCISAYEEWKSNHNPQNPNGGLTIQPNETALQFAQRLRDARNSKVSGGRFATELPTWVGDDVDIENEYMATIVSWFNKNNLDWAKGKTRNEIFGHFGKDLVPIYHIPIKYVGLFGDRINDMNVYCSEGYFIDHAVNRHPNADLVDYLLIQDVLNNPDGVKDVSRGTDKVIAFTKKYDRWNGVLVQLEVGKDGKILFHKTLLRQEKEPYAKQNDIRPKSSSLVGGVSTISPAKKAAAISLQSRNDVSGSKDNTNSSNDQTNSQNSAKIGSFSVSNQYDLDTREGVEAYLDDADNLKELVYRLREAEDNGYGNFYVAGSKSIVDMLSDRIGEEKFEDDEDLSTIEDFINQYEEYEREYYDVWGGRMDNPAEDYFNDFIPEFIGDTNIRFSVSNENQRVFVSNAAQAVDKIKQEKATPQQWLAMLTKEGGIKAGEDKWMGLSDWLKSSTANTLTKDEVKQFIRENAIQIEEVKYSESIDFNKDLKKKAAELYGNEVNKAYKFDYDEYGGNFVPFCYDYAIAAKIYNETHNGNIPEDEDEITFEHEGILDEFGLEIIYNIGNELESSSSIREINGTRLEYTTKGLDKKREIALTVPTVESWNKNDKIHFGDAGNGRAVGWIRFGETTTGLTDKGRKRFSRELLDKMEKQLGHLNYERMSDADKAEYDNIQAFYRGENDDYYHGGDERVLVIDEIQSKRHQEGREKGYNLTQSLRDKAKQEWTAYDNAMRQKYAKQIEEDGGDLLWTEYATQEELDKFDEISSRAQDRKGERIPDAPFDKNWAELCFKRMLRLASEEGYDRVAWTTGKQQANRYNLSEDVDKITTKKYDDSDDYVVVTGYKNGRSFERLVKTSELGNTIGVKNAEKVLNSESREITIEGDMLSIGGEGMKAFYDQMLPSFVKKYVKKWGATVEDVTLPNVEEAGRVMHSVNITPEMKESVMQGQGMFSVDNGSPELETEESISDYERRLQEHVGQVMAEADLTTDGRTMRDLAIEARIRVAELHTDNAEEVAKAMRTIKDRINAIRDAKALQRAWDRTTAREVNNLAKIFVTHGWADGVSRSDIKRILASIQQSVGRKDISKQLDLLIDAMTRTQLNKMEGMWKKLLKAPTKVNQAGVSVARGIAPEQAQIIEGVREFLKGDPTSFFQQEGDINDKLDDEKLTPERRRYYENRREALEIARDYFANIVGLQSSIRDIEREIMDVESNKKADKTGDNALYNEMLNSLREERRNLTLELADNYSMLVQKMAGIRKEGHDEYKRLAEERAQRKDDLIHDMNRDTEGVDPEVYPEKRSAAREKMESIGRYISSPAHTLLTELKRLAIHAPEGKGYLYNRFAYDLMEASENEWNGKQEARKMLDDKVKELFGKKYDWIKLMNEYGKDSHDVGATLHNKLTREKSSLSSGQLMYLYMVNKMSDGKMKLRKMQISEENVEAIKNLLLESEPRLIELADWLQDSFLPTLRGKYSQTYMQMYNAPMPEVKNYVPLKILSSALVQNMDLNDREGNNLPSTVVGNIIKRTVNTKAVDINGTDIFELMLEHVDTMEHWNAYAQVIQDLNTLLSSRTFRNKMEAMKHGSFRRFKNLARIATGSYAGTSDYKPGGDLGDIVRLVGGAKVALRFQTALKQILSFPAFLDEANAKFYKYGAINMVKPAANIKWCLGNLPLMEKRWKSRQIGDEKLDFSEIGKVGTGFNTVVNWLQKHGMKANASVDLLICCWGAKSVYDARLADYLERGYEKKDAERRARLDAEIAYNETQQSSEGLMMSKIQSDRDLSSTFISLFNNSSFAYGRKFLEGARETKKIFTEGEKRTEFRKRQLINQGVAEEEAEALAKEDTKRATAKALVDLAIFGYFIQFCWNMGGSFFPGVGHLIGMIVGGGDPDKDKDFWKDLAIQSAIQPIRGFVFGASLDNTLKELIKISHEKRDGKFNARNHNWGEFIGEQVHPAVGDLAGIIQEIVTDPEKRDAWKATNQIVRFAASMGAGADPQVIANMVYGISDMVAHYDKITWQDVYMDFGMIMNAPQSEVRPYVLQPREGETMQDFTQRYIRFKTIQTYGTMYPFVEYKPSKNELRNAKKKRKEQSDGK